MWWIQFSSVTQLCLPLCNPMDCSMPGFPVYHQLLELAHTHVPWVGDAIQTILSSISPFSCLQSFPASGSFPMSQFFPSGGQNTGASFSVSFSPSNEYSGLISFRIDWFDILAVQGTLKSLLSTTEQSISSLVFSFVYGPTLTTIYDYQKNQSFDYTDLYR